MLKYKSKVFLKLLLFFNVFCALAFADMGVTWQTQLIENTYKVLPQNIQTEIKNNFKNILEGAEISDNNTLAEIINKINNLKNSISTSNQLSPGNFNDLGKIFSSILKLYDIDAIYKEYYFKNMETNSGGVVFVDNLSDFLNKKSLVIKDFLGLIQNNESSPGLFKRLNTEISTVLSAIYLYTLSNHYKNIVVLNSDFNKVYPAEKLSVNLGIKSDNKSNVYLYYVSPNENGFVRSNYTITNEITPFNDIDDNIKIKKVFSNLVWKDTSPGKYYFYTVIADSKLKLLTNIYSIKIEILNPFEFSLTKLTDEPYKMIYKQDKQNLGYKVIHSLYMVFLGDVEDDKNTIEDESNYYRLIPGYYSHSLMYFGRDFRGLPYGAEMTTALEGREYDIRYARFLDKFDDIFDTENIDLYVSTKRFDKYSNTDSKKLKDEYFAKLLNVKDEYLNRIDYDIAHNYRYQLEFDWSGSLIDKNVYLIDDGLANGASCTDYWVSLFEDYAEICIKGIRETSDEIKNYFLTDPIGMNAKIPYQLNPFPMELYIKDLVPMGFKLNDPPPHIFKCDNTTETGLILPGKLHDADVFDSVPVTSN